MLQRRRGRPRLHAASERIPDARRPERTSIGLTAEDLTVLAHVLAAGLVMLRESRRHRALSKVKAALTRMDLPTPAGL